MAGSTKRRLVTEKRGFRVKPIRHPRYKYVVYRIEDGRRVEQTYFQSERAANSRAYAQNIRLKNEGLEGQVLGPELRGQAIEVFRRLSRYGKSLRDAVDFYEIYLKSEASLREIKLEHLYGTFSMRRKKVSPARKGGRLRLGTSEHFVTAWICSAITYETTA